MQRAVLCVIWGVLMASNVQAGFQPGDVFREYTWRPDGKWQRVTGPDAPDERAHQFLPNAVNRIVIDDLEGATRIEVYVEMLLCHAGTANKRMRINGGDWIAISEPALIPGDRGVEDAPGEYQYMWYPQFDVPMDAFVRGENTFEFTCSSGTALGRQWPQWILYGVTFRVYYRVDKPHSEGRIVTPVSGSVLGNSPEFAVETDSQNSLRQVDLIGLYDDFNWEGDGNDRQWHYRYFFGEIQNHMGTAVEAPYRVVWDTEWIPIQSGPIRVCARIVDETGLCFITPAVGDLRLKRDETVRMYQPYDVPRRWHTRAGKRQECKVDVPDDLSEATDARIFMSTWNGIVAEEIGINDVKVTEKIGKNHDLSYDVFSVPIDLIRPGENTFYTFSDTQHHGIEVQWPGMVLMVRYKTPESP